jgi:hypothetical protein
MHARFGWTSGDDPDGDGQPCIRAHARGWDWHAPLGGGRAAWVSLRIEDPAARAPDRLGADVTWRIHPACAGPGYFLLGDAAATLDPSSSHGVLRAVMSGMLCAHAVARDRREAPPRSETIGNYRNWMRGQFAHDVDRMRALYQGHPSAALASLFAAASTPASDRSVAHA